MMELVKGGIQQMDNFILTKLIYFQKQNPNIYIGGSVSLILQNYIPYRIPKDIDIISPNKIHIFDIFDIDREKSSRIKFIKFNELKWDLFINPKAEYIEYNTKFGILKISPIEEILEWKKKWLLKKPLDIKHKKDLSPTNIITK